MESEVCCSRVIASTAGGHCTATASAPRTASSDPAEPSYVQQRIWLRIYVASRYYSIPEVSTYWRSISSSVEKSSTLGLATSLKPFLPRRLAKLPAQNPKENSLAGNADGRSRSLGADDGRGADDGPAAARLSAMTVCKCRPQWLGRKPFFLDHAGTW